jgi:hypothetical protein
MRKNNKGFAITEVLILSTVIIGVLIFMYSQFKNINRNYQYNFNYDTPTGMYKANNLINFIDSDKYDYLAEQLNLTPEGYIDITDCDVEKLYRLIGDINGDRFVDSRDASIIENLISKTNNNEEFTEEESKQYIISDINKDGKVNSADSDLILKYYSILSTSGATVGIRYNETEKEYCELLLNSSDIEQILFTTENLKKLKENSFGIDSSFLKYINQIQTINSENDHRLIIKYKDKTYASMRFNKGNAYVKSGLMTYLDAINNTGNGHREDIMTWKDLSNNKHDISLKNNPTWTNNSLILNGINNYGILENTNRKIFLNGVTIEIRARIISKTSPNRQEIIGNWKETGKIGGLGIELLNTNNIYASIATENEWFSIQDTNNINLNEYYTIAMTFDNKIQKIYINGNLVQEKNQIDSIPISSSTNPIVIGGKTIDGGIESYSNIEYQNILIYDRPLTETELKRNYQIDLSRY